MCYYLENEAKREEKDCLPDLLEAMKMTVKLMLVYVFSACVFPFAFLVFLSEFIPLLSFCAVFLPEKVLCLCLQKWRASWRSEIVASGMASWA
jgi:hypothetical protein